MRPSLTSADRDALQELVPLVRRVAALDAGTLVRFRRSPARASVLARLPFGVLVGRTVAAPGGPDALDVVTGAGAALDWLAGDAPEPPAPRDVEWRGALPPAEGWARVEAVPDDVVRPLVRSGALALQDAAAREGVPGAQPRAGVTDALLDSVVLTVDDGAGTRAQITLRALSALTRMGFLPRGSQVRIDVRGRWTRVVAEYGSVYLERPGGLGLA